MRLFVLHSYHSHRFLIGFITLYSIIHKQRNKPAYLLFMKNHLLYDVLLRSILESFSYSVDYQTCSQFLSHLQYCILYSDFLDIFADEKFSASTH